MLIRHASALFLLAFATSVTAVGAQTIPRQDGAESTRTRRGTGVEEGIPVKITVKLSDVRLEDALQEIARKANARLSYSRSIVPIDRRVTIDLKDATTLEAIGQALAGTDLEPQVAKTGQIILVKKKPAAAPGNVQGRVSDAKTGEPLLNAEVSLEGTRLRTTTGDKGYYRLTGVEPGKYTLTVRRVGYARTTRAISVASDEELALDIALDPVATQLNEIVTTATGEQRLLELGHVVGRINADSVVKAAPISSLSELLNGRVTGLQVFQGQGTVGGKVSLQSRGMNSLLLGNEPIIVVDGVRYTNTAPNPRLLIGAAYTEQTSPLNDLNPNDVESIEVVKGPSAATLYGTDAANGVIVIRTKRGQAGPARWNAYARASRTSISSDKFTDTRIAYGTEVSSGSPTSFCPLVNVAIGYCTIDSIVAIRNPLKDPATSIFSSQPRWEGGANVSGGRNDVRYYLSADVASADGPIRMPPRYLDRLKQLRGVDELPDEYVHPNTLDNLNLRASLTAPLASKVEVRVNSGYIRGAIRSLPIDNPYSGVVRGSPTEPYNRRFEPTQTFSQISTERTDRFVGSASMDGTPTRWLLTRATVGLDLGTRNRMSLIRTGEFGNYSSGAVQDDRTRQVATTGEFGATATARTGRVTSRTSIGMQYVRTLSDGISSGGTGLPPGGTSVGEAASVRSGQRYVETVTLGSYLEQSVGLNERLYLTGAARIDGASAFGQNYDAVVYPKASVSWLASEEPFFPRIAGLETLRLRYAFGASGQQPIAAWSHPTYRANVGFANEQRATTIQLAAVGNPDLRPEKVREHEFGFDASGIDGRVEVALTWFSRRTVDQIVSTALPPGYGDLYTNLGLTKQHGFEAELTARVIESRDVTWELIARHGLQRTQLVDVGSASQYGGAFGGYVEGYPLGARFLRRMTYNDFNHDGVLSRGEVSTGDRYYVGESVPPIQQSITTMLGFFDRRVRLSALVERRKGFMQINEQLTDNCGAFGCPAMVDASTPLQEQANAIGAGDGFAFFERGDFTRLREVTLAYDVPSPVARALRVRSATVSVSGRNLALWTDFTGPDPESANSGGAANNQGGVPQGRTWTLRFDLGL